MNLIECAKAWNKLGRWGNEGDLLFPFMSVAQKEEYLGFRYGVTFIGYENEEIEDIWYGRTKLFDEPIKKYTQYTWSSHGFGWLNKEVEIKKF